MDANFKNNQQVPFEVTPEPQHPQIRQQTTPEIPNIFSHQNAPCPHDHSAKYYKISQFYHKNQIYPIIFPNDQ